MIGNTKTENETLHQTEVAKVKVTLVRDDHDNENQHYEEAQEVQPEDETLHQSEVAIVTVAHHASDHEEDHKVIEAENYIAKETLQP